MKAMFLALAAIASMAPAAALAQQPAADQPAAAPDYAQDSAWLCLPGRASDPCGAPLPTVALNTDGYGEVLPSRIAADAPVDCFYVYPTVSRDRPLNSDLEVGAAEERGAAMVQFARFAEACRPFAPIYRSLTLSGLVPAAMGQDLSANFNLAYEDVRNAWRQYLAARNNGRPFVLVGHSQGSIHLQRLIREEIEGQPVAARMVSAIIPGWNVLVPEGRDVGGTFRSTPLCTRAGQTGCVVSYVSFRDGVEPPVGATYGRSDTPLFGPPPPGLTVGCTNPAALGSQEARPLQSVWFGGQAGGAGPIAWSSTGAPPVPFLRTDGLVTARCVNRGPFGYLAVRVNADPADARTDDIPGDVVILGRPMPGWGLHPADMPLALGDLVALVRTQSAAWRAANPR
jgi:hypothetical protein